MTDSIYSHECDFTYCFLTLLYIVDDVKQYPLIVMYNDYFNDKIHNNQHEPDFLEIE